MNHHKTNQGTTTTNQQFNYSRYVYTSLVRGLTRTRESWPPAYKNQQILCDSKGSTHTQFIVFQEEDFRRRRRRGKTGGEAVGSWIGQNVFLVEL